MNTKNTIKGFGLFLAMMLCCGFMFAQPLNDLCTNSEDIDCGDDVQGTTIGASFDNVGTCGTSNTAAGVWYNIPGTGGAITVSTCNQAAYDTKISVFTGTCGSLTCVGGQDDATGCAGFTTEFSWLSNAANDYLVLVHGFGTSTGTFTLSASCATVATGNDACSGATALSCNSTVLDSTTNATPDFAPFCGTSNTAPGVWYEITPPNGSTLTLSTCSANTTYDTKISVFTGGCGVLTCVDGNDDDFDCPNSIFQSTVSICADGSTYLVLVHGFGTATGTFELTATCSAGPANDDACNATMIMAGDTLPFDNNCASTQAGEPLPPAGSDGGSTCTSQNGWCDIIGEPFLDATVWFSFAAPASGTVTIDASGFDSQLALYEVGNCSDFSTYTLVAANDDVNGLEAQLTEVSCLNPGQIYYIQVDGFNGAASSNATIGITEIPGTPLTVDAGDCQTSFVGYGPAEGLNFLEAAASGGDGSYTYSWSCSGGGLQYSDGAQAAVEVLMGCDTCTVTVTDGRGCSVSDDVEICMENLDAGNGQVNMCCSPATQGPLNCDFDTDGSGNFLAAGTIITNQYANRGVNISALSNGMYDVAMIFNSAAPTGGDLDLGTPNIAFGGPGRGSGGNPTNNVPLGNVLIISEDGDQSDPDDEARGGQIIIDFDCPTTIDNVVFLDADDGPISGNVFTCITSGGVIGPFVIPHLGNNSVYTAQLGGVQDVIQLKVEFAGSGALASFQYRPQESQVAVDSADVDSLLALNGFLSFSLGDCGNTCRATNPPFNPPPACVDLIVDLQLDNFPTETGWTLVDVTSGVTIADIAPNTYTTPGQVISDTFCVDPNHCFDFTITDDFGDGICCGFGLGNYTVTFDGTPTPSPTGGSFGASETITVGGANCKTNSLTSDREMPALKVTAYPNPFTDLANVKFKLEESDNVVIHVFDLQGQLVSEIYNGYADAGAPVIATFDGSQYDNGIYIYRLTTASGLVETGRIVLQR